MKTFEFHNAKMTIESKGYGQYTLSGLGTSVHCTDSKIWDYCTDSEDKKKHAEAKRAAYKLLKAASHE